MGNKLPTRKERQALIEIHKYINLHRKFPDNKTLSEILQVEPPRTSKLKEGLRAKGYLAEKRGNERLTENAINYLTDSENLPGYKIVLSATVPLAGEVSAGRGSKYDELAVYLDDQDQPTNEISIPNLGNTGDKRIIALRVRGISMESAGILDGDYVIVALIDEGEFWKFRENQMIVTEYLSSEDADELDDEIIDSSNLSLTGFTLKIYRGESLDKSGKTVHKLGRLRDYGQSNPYEIQARVIKPVGKVIGVYRDITKQ